MVLIQVKEFNRIKYFLVDGGVETVVPNPPDESKDAGNSTLTLRKKGKLTSSWQIDHQFAFQVSAVARLNCDVTDNRQVDVSSLFV